MVWALRRDSKAFLLWFVVIALAGGVGWWYWRIHPDPAMPEGVQKVTVRSVLDGDSMEVVALNPGRVITTADPVRLRLLGIDAPEMGTGGAAQCWAEKAKADLGALAPPGSHLWVLSDVEPLDAQGNQLLYAWTEDGAFVNERLAEAGSARPMFAEPNVRYKMEISKKADAARQARRGLWGACSS